jgi:hypothetical protein
MRRIIMLATSVAATVVTALATAVPAGAFPLPDFSSNWAGYAAVPPTGYKMGGVLAGFVVPAINCATSRGNAPFDAAFWVGIGGKPGTGLEQVGVIGRCETSSSLPEYWAFWEMVPQNSFAQNFNDSIPIAAGDHVSLYVLGPNITKVNRLYKLGIQVGDGTPFHVEQATLNPSVVSGTTAEVISEWPGEDTWFGLGKAGIADFGTVRYRGAHLLATGGVSPWASFAVTQHKINMVKYGSDGVRQTVISTSAPETTPDFGAITGDMFTTTFTGNWPS